MRKFAVVVAALALMAVPIASASATSVKGATKFTAAYTDPIYGAVACTGKHVVNPKKFAGSRDVEHCRSTEASKRLLTLLAAEHGTGVGFPGAESWSSDFNAATATSIEWTVNSSRRAFNMVAVYAS